MILLLLLFHPTTHLWGFSPARLKNGFPPSRASWHSHSGKQPSPQGAYHLRWTLSASRLGPKIYELTGYHNHKPLPFTRITVSSLVSPPAITIALSYVLATHSSTDSSDADAQKVIREEVSSYFAKYYCINEKRELKKTKRAKIMMIIANLKRITKETFESTSCPTTTLLDPERSFTKITRPTPVLAIESWQMTWVRSSSSCPKLLMVCI